MIASMLVSGLRVLVFNKQQTFSSVVTIIATHVDHRSQTTSVSPALSCYYNVFSCYVLLLMLSLFYLTFPINKHISNSHSHQNVKTDNFHRSLDLMWSLCCFIASSSKEDRDNYYVLISAYA